MHILPLQRLDMPPPTCQAQCKPATKHSATAAVGGVLGRMFALGLTFSGWCCTLAGYTTTPDNFIEGVVLHPRLIFQLLAT